ncbi:hypothetical protein MTP99_001089 [Tenebrio molitor]|nr:hypothetical protein MTP99_001089 [Tenebrio molitor]CAH1364720.1 unnamed protein product [Tenebrio molitor]
MAHPEEHELRQEGGEEGLTQDLNALRDQVNAIKERISIAINDNRTMHLRVKMKTQQVLRQVDHEFEQYRAELRRRRIEVINRIRQEQHSRISSLQTQVQQLTNVSERLVYVGKNLQTYTAGNVRQNIIINEIANDELNHLRNLSVEPCVSDYLEFIPCNRRIIASLGRLEAPINLYRLEAIGPRPQLPTPSAEGEPSTSGAQALALPNQIPNGHMPLTLLRNESGRPSLIFGRPGSNDGELLRPWGICCNKLGHFIVSDRCNNRIQVFDTDGRFLYKFGSAGEYYGQFQRPAGITVNVDNQIVVCDKDNHRIQIFTMEGNFLGTFGSKGSDNGKFFYPWDVSCSTTRKIVVSDSRNDRVQVFTATGEFISKFSNKQRNCYFPFEFPRGVCFAPDETIVVSDFNNHRIVFLQKRFQRTQYWGGQEGDGDYQFSRPQGIVIDDSGNIVIADSKNNRILVYDRFGGFQYKFGRCGTAPGAFSRPQAICLTPAGRIAVVDGENNRIQVF